MPPVRSEIRSDVGRGRSDGTARQWTCGLTHRRERTDRQLRSVKLSFRDHAALLAQAQAASPTVWQNGVTINVGGASGGLGEWRL
jgi:hypothetical protein